MILPFFSAQAVPLRRRLVKQTEPPSRSHGKIDEVQANFHLSAEHVVLTQIAEKAHICYSLWFVRCEIESDVDKLSTEQVRVRRRRERMIQSLMRMRVGAQEQYSEGERDAERAGCGGWTRLGSQGGLPELDEVSPEPDPATLQ